MNEIEDQILVEQIIGLTNCSENLISVFDSSDRLRFANKSFHEAYFIDSDATPTWIELMRENYERRRGAIVRHPAFDAWVLGIKSRRGATGYRAFEADLYGGRCG